MMTEPNDNKRKRALSSGIYGTKCICCNPKCDEAMGRLKIHNPSRYAYFGIPSEPKETKKKPSEKERVARERKTQRRKRILAALPISALERSRDKSYSSSSKMHFASLHLHDLIYNLCPKSASGNTLLVDSISSELANLLSVIIIVSSLLRINL